jgi:hypothetical protein
MKIILRIAIFLLWAFLMIWWAAMYFFINAMPFASWADVLLIWSFVGFAITLVFGWVYRAVGRW